MTRLDGNCSYWKIPIWESDRDKTCFTSHSGTYRYNGMPFGLSIALATFYLAPYIILSVVRWQIGVVYLEDVIFSLSAFQHTNDVAETLSLLRKVRIPLKLNKCAFF